jgi:hypothetical protein
MLEYNIRLIDISVDYLSTYQVILICRYIYIYRHVKDKRNTTAVMFFQVEKYTEQNKNMISLFLD